MTESLFNGQGDEIISKMISSAQAHATAGGVAVSTAHLFLALVEAQSTLSGIFKSFALGARELKQVVAAVDRKREQKESPEFTGPARQALRRASLSSAQRHSEHVEPIDLLLGLLAPGEVLDGDDFNVISAELGLDLEQLRHAVIAQLQKQNLAASGATLLVNGSSSSSTPTRTVTPTLEKYTRDLNQWGREGKLAPCTWRGAEIAKLIQILGMRYQNNPVLVGDAGVGTIATVEGLVLQILSGEVPESLKNIRVFQLDIGSITAGSKYRGEFEERLEKITKEVTDAGDIILLIEDIHSIVGAGSIEGGPDATSFLKPLLARGELRCIGTTSPDEYRKRIEGDSNLNGLFQRIEVAELSVEGTVSALQAVKSLYETYHGVTYTEAALLAAAQLSARYLHTIAQPGKSTQLLDRAGSIRKNSRSHREVMTVDAADIAELVSSDTGIPLASLSETEADKLLGMADALHQGIIGQQNAVNSVQSAFWRLRVGLKPANRPIASFFFLGPTGVGKTELARELARYLFNTADALIRLDMSEYMDPSSVSKLIGTSAGYVGYKDPGQLTEPIRRRPYSVLLLDEIEKAHPAVLNLLLQVLDAGKLTDGAGREVDFKNVVVIATSNVGAKVISGGLRAIGINVGDPPPVSERKSSVLEQELSSRFSPEFLNRWDEVIEFDKLSDEQLKAIVQLFIKKTFSILELQWNIRLVLSTAAADLVVRRSDPKYGARPLGRILQKAVETPLAEGILRGDFLNCDIRIVVAKSADGGDEIALEKVESVSP